MAEQWREIEAEWQSGGAFIGRNVAGGIVQMGTLADNPGISPMELVLVGLAGCTGVDIVDILVKKRQPLRGLKVKVRGKKAEDFPKVYREIEVEYLIFGKDIDPKAVEHAIRLSEEKYCSVSAMLRSSADIRSTYQIIDPDV
ncbi:MAG: osmotically inducible protein OsmC [Anaerolineales bacterium]|nr:OsmC family protein [Anaerolineae bacterium]PWB53090.1 MAG: osmotically inducible protein OsmC [Anaerolineales bacterium]